MNTIITNGIATKVKYKSYMVTSYQEFKASKNVQMCRTCLQSFSFSLCTIEK